MYPEDRVIVGVVRRRRDVTLLLQARWYRIPQAHMPDGVFTEYLAFFLSASLFDGARGGAVCYYAPLRGVELARRRDLLPQEPRHPRANALYYQCQLGEVLSLASPITNPTRRRFAFVYTTFDRLLAARTLPELYSEEAYFVRRVYDALPRAQTLARKETIYFS